MPSEDSFLDGVKHYANQSDGSKLNENAEGHAQRSRAFDDCKRERETIKTTVGLCKRTLSAKVDLNRSSPPRPGANRREHVRLLYCVRGIGNMRVVLYVPAGRFRVLQYS